MALYHYDPSAEASEYLESCSKAFKGAIARCDKRIDDAEAHKAFSRAWQKLEVAITNFENKDSPQNAREFRKAISLLTDKVIALTKTAKSADKVIEAFENYSLAHESIYPFKRIPLQDRIYKSDDPSQGRG